MQPRYYQQAAHDAAWHYLKNQSGEPLIVLPTGCHGIGHPILMSDGSVLPVESIEPGHRVMGPDGLPRTVMCLCRGEDELFEITPIGGETKSESFIVNGNHVLHLEATREGKPFPSSLKGGERVNITVNDYLEKSKYWKHLWKLRQSDEINFPALQSGLFEEDLDIPPYIVGMMLGDGHMKHSINLTTADGECADEFLAFAESHSWTIRTSSKGDDNKASSHTIQSGTQGKSCTAKKLFSKYGLLGKTGSRKTVPKEFLLADVESRLELLAGLIDSDGYHDGRGGITFSNKSKLLAEDTAFIARSLGMRARISETWKRSQTSEKRKYFIVSLSGDTSRIPSRLERKTAPERRQKKNVLRIGFSVKPIGRGKFYGFTLSGDHLYLDGNFIIHHNSGKSLVIAMLVEQARKFDARVVVLQHRKELIEQNAEKIQILLPDINIGIYSAGLKRKEITDDVVVAGIQSIYRKANELGRRELILIDEVHLVGGNDDSMYGQFLSDIRMINPRARMVGLTATPFRTGEGPICGKNKLFQRICYEAFTGDLIRQGFLCPITNKAAANTVDTSQIKKRGSEFVSGDMARAFDSGDKVVLACSEIVQKCHDRHSVLVFSAGVEHAEHVAETLREMTGERIGLVTGETFPMERVQTLNDFKDGSLRWLISVDCLTTGFDAPCIDAIAILRATMSPGLFAQIVGRGLRKHESVSNCLILDFGGNIARHGSIDDPNYGRATPSRSGGSGEAVEKNGRGKECLNCGIDVPAGERECPECGFLFSEKPRHDVKADEESTLTGQPDPETWEVVGCAWGVHVKRNAPPDTPRTLRVDYTCKPMDSDGGNLTQKVVSEWVCFEHGGFARVKAVKWWEARSTHDVPQTIDDAVAFLDRHVARVPATITTQQEGKYQRIVSVEFVDEIPGECEWLDVIEDDIHFSFGSDVPF